MHTGMVGAQTNMGPIVLAETKVMAGESVFLTACEDEIAGPFLRREVGSDQDMLGAQPCEAFLEAEGTHRGGEQDHLRPQA